MSESEGIKTALRGFGVEKDIEEFAKYIDLCYHSGVFKTLMTRVEQSWDKVEGEEKKRGFVEFISKKVESSLEGKDIKLQEWREFKYEIINNIYSGEKPKQAEEGAEAKKAAEARAAEERRAAAEKKQMIIRDLKRHISDTANSGFTSDTKIADFDKDTLIDLLLLRVVVLKLHPKEIKTDKIIDRLSKAINNKLGEDQKIDKIPEILYKAVKQQDGKWKSFIKWFKKNITQRAKQKAKEQTTREHAEKLLGILSSKDVQQGLRGEYATRINRNVLNGRETQSL